MHLNGRFRAMWHSNAAFLVAEAVAPEGLWTLLPHNLTGMSDPSPQWAATTFVDKGRTFVFAANWIQARSDWVEWGAVGWSRARGRGVESVVCDHKRSVAGASRSVTRRR